MTPPIPFDFNNLRDEQDNSSSQSITPCPTQPTTETETRTQQESPRFSTNSKSTRTPFRVNSTTSALDPIQISQISASLNASTTLIAGVGRGSSSIRKSITSTATTLSRISPPFQVSNSAARITEISVENRNRNPVEAADEGVMEMLPPAIPSKKPKNRNKQSQNKATLESVGTSDSRISTEWNQDQGPGGYGQIREVEMDEGYRSRSDEAQEEIEYEEVEVRRENKRYAESADERNKRRRKHSVEIEIEEDKDLAALFDHRSSSENPQDRDLFYEENPIHSPPAQQQSRTIQYAQQQALSPSVGAQSRFTTPYEGEEDNEPVQNEPFTSADRAVRLFDRLRDEEGGEERLNKWMKCTDEEWSKGGAELVTRFSGLLERVTKLIIAKSLRTKEFEAELETHKRVLEERGDLMQIDKSNLKGWAAEMLSGYKKV